MVDCDSDYYSPALRKHNGRLYCPFLLLIYQRLEMCDIEGDILIIWTGLWNALNVSTADFKRFHSKK